MEHRGSSFVNSCVKVPVDPYSRQPTPSYERPCLEIDKKSIKMKNRKINFAKNDREYLGSSDESNLDSFIEFIESIPDYGQVHHLSNEQFKQKLDYLKRKQRLLLKNLKNCLDDDKTMEINDKISLENKREIKLSGELKLTGKKCNLEDSRSYSPLIFDCGNFSSLAEDQDLLTYRCKEKDKAMKTMRNRELHSATKSWSTWSGSKSSDSDKDFSDSIETRSLPPNSPRRWNSGVSKSPPTTLRDSGDKYTTTPTPDNIIDDSKKSKDSQKKRRNRPIPLASRIPLYDKLLAAKEERSRMIREESTWSLLSQVKPFHLECDRRAVKSHLSRSTPELSMKNEFKSFKAKPVPSNLFSTQVYDRMLEDEYFRELQKKIRAAELMRVSSLPPSMARRERIKTAYVPRMRECIKDELQNESFRNTPLTTDRSRSAMTDVSARGNNLAAILRCQASREKLEREIQSKLEEQARSHAIRMREMATGRKPAWRALRTAARKEHARDLDYRATLRRDESREQAERHRLEMELMLNRVRQIPTLFERYSQSFQAMRHLQSPRSYNLERRKKKKKQSKSNVSSSATSIADSRSDSGTLTNSLKSTDSTKSGRRDSIGKKKNERGGLRVSINETAELIEDPIDNNDIISQSSDNDRA